VYTGAMLDSEIVEEIMDEMTEEQRDEIRHEGAARLVDGIMIAYGVTRDEARVIVAAVEEECDA
jgi:hypothetical protein